MNSTGALQTDKYTFQRRAIAVVCVICEGLDVLITANHSFPQLTFVAVTLFELSYVFLQEFI